MIKAILLTVVSIIIIAAITLYCAFFNPFVYVPQIGKNLDSNIKNSRTQFQNRVAETFPTGTPEASLTQELSKQKFNIKENQANYSYSRFPCTYLLIITWETNSEKNISKIQGDRRLTCL